MKAVDVASWMVAQLKLYDYLYQDDVVDHLVRAKADHLLRENADGNLVIGREVLEQFKALTEADVVWVKPERYWRWRVNEDEPGRDARG